jgi:hypothetical protein
VRVEDARAVQVHVHPGAAGPVEQPLQLGQRLDQPATAVVRVLHRDGRGGGEVPVAVRSHLGDQLVGRQPAGDVGATTGGAGDDGAAGEPEQRGRGTHLVGEHMAVGVAQDLLSGLADQPQADLVAHRPGGDEERRLVAEQVGDVLLQRVDRGVLAVDVVADLGLGHRPAHRRGGPGEGVRPEVDRAGVVGGAIGVDPVHGLSPGASR